MRTTFSEYTYQRPDLAKIEEAFRAVLNDYESAETFAAQNAAFEQINALREAFGSMHSLCQIRHTQAVNDAFYEAEHDFFNLHSPKFEALNQAFYRALVASKFRRELEEKWGSQLFTIAELSLKTFQPAIVELLQRENQLRSEYVKIKASAKIPFDGKELNLSALIPYETSPDRSVRKAASEAKWHFFAENAPTIEGIFDQLVKVRHQIARVLGYENFVELGYARMLRSDYTPDMVRVFREGIRTEIVPIAKQLYRRQAQRLGLPDLKFYDVNFHFKSGNAKPQGDAKWIVKNAAVMYGELSDETKRFFDFMQTKELMDLEARNGKATGGYCTYISNYASPFIFANFNGTSGDIDVLTHEAGHAFQVFLSRDFNIGEYHFPTYEACEIHSMSMEFFTWKWMERFFQHETAKYKFAHLSGALLFLPYGVSVDDFQHFVYANPDATPAERNAAWREIERKYTPHLNYEGFDFLENGGFWQKQNHIFDAPFYYIDYCLAQVCAFQFWQKDQDNHQAAWRDYLKLCKAGGSLSFLQLVKLAGLASPFEEGVVARAIQPVKAWLDAVDDSSF